MGTLEKEGGETAATETDTTVTEAPEDAWLTYDQARKQLATIDFYLDGAKRRDVKEKIRWGWIGTDSVERQEKLLEEKARISPRALSEIMQAIQEGKGFQLIFSFEGYSPERPGDSVFDNNPVTLLRREFSRAADSLGFLQDHRTYQPAEKLLKTFSQPERGGSTSEDLAIIFTPDDHEVANEMIGKSPNEYWHNFQEEGKRGLTTTGIFQKPDIELLRPLEWIEFSLRLIDNGLRTLYPDRQIDEMDSGTFRRFRREVIRDDRRIDAYFPDTHTVTLFPHWRRRQPEDIYKTTSSSSPDWKKAFENKTIDSDSLYGGPALGLKWEINNGKARIVVISCGPDEVLKDAGPRRSFGRRRRPPPSMPY